MRFVLKQEKTKAQFDEAEDQLSVHARQKEEGKYLLFLSCFLGALPPALKTQYAHTYTRNEQKHEVFGLIRARSCILNPRRQVTRPSMDLRNHQESGTGISALQSNHKKVIHIDKAGNRNSNRIDA